MLPSFGNEIQRLSQQGEPFFCLRSFPIRLSQQAEEPRRSQLCSRGPVGGDALAYLRNRFFLLSLPGERPAPQDRPPRQEERNPMLRRDRNGCLGPLLGCLPFPTQLVEPGSKHWGEGQAHRLRQLPSQDQCFVDSLQSLVRIAQMPQRLGRKAEAGRPRIISIEKDMGEGGPGVIEGNPLLQVL